MAQRLVTQAIVVDRVELQRLGIASALEQTNVRVVGQFAGAPDAMRLAERVAPDLVVVGEIDDMSPVDVVLRLRRSPDILVMALGGGPRLAQELASAGADAVLTRFAKIRDVVDAIEAMRKGDRYIAPELMDSLTFGQAPDRSLLADPILSAKELEVLGLVGRGMSNKDIAKELVIAPETVKAHLRHIYSKLDVTSRRSALAKGVSLGLLA
jgi:DNA-binding NarL/FixJ family response regulator